MNQTTNNMKKLVLFFFIFSTSLVKAQSPEEAKVVQLINEYRASRNLDPLDIHQGLNKAAAYQVKYEVLIDSITHQQYQNLPNFEEIPNPGDRIRKFAGIEPPLGGTEISMGTFVNKGYYDIYITRPFYLEREKHILKSYQESSKHNKILLNPLAKKIGISIYSEEIIKGKDVKFRLFCVITFGE